MISSEVALLEVALKDALKLAAPLPTAERPAFIGRCLCAAHKGVEAPSASTDAAPDPTSLKEDLPELSKILSAAVNAACGREGWPLLAVGNQLLSTANGAASTAEASAVVAASPAAAALSPAAAPLPSRRHRNQRGGASRRVRRAGEEIEARAGKFGNLGKGKGRATGESSGTAGNAGGGGGDSSGGLTFAEMEKRNAKSRPKTLPPSALEKLEMDEVEEGAQSARVAHPSWSLTGGTRESSFKKRARPSGEGRGGAERPPSVGFAAVLSLSGWSDVDAQEVTIKNADQSKGSLSERENVSGEATGGEPGGEPSSVKSTASAMGTETFVR